MELCMIRHWTVGHVWFVALLFGLAPESRPSRWFSPDRVKHFFLSFFVQSASYSAARAANLGNGPALAAATGVTAAASLAKELSDRRHGTGFDRRDLVWDALGAGAATALLARTVKQ
jgi:uncharacterized protein YfiM (DUF2279 family)